MKKLSCAFLFLLASACASTSTRLVSHVDDEAAQASAAGVRITAQGGWSGQPGNLDDMATPLFLRVENQSGRPITLRLSGLALQSTTGRTYTAQSPFAVRSTAPALALDSSLDTSIVSMSPSTYGPYFDGSGGGTFDNVSAPPAQGTRVDPFNTPDLPTRDMLDRAFNEGVIDDGTERSGYVYFRRVPPDAGSVELMASIVSTEDGEVLGEVRIPLRVKQERVGR